ncbi:MAG: IS5 family transposase [Acidimicrobiales bacterium]
MDGSRGLRASLEAGANPLRPRGRTSTDLAVDGRGHDQGSTQRRVHGSKPTDRAKRGVKRSLQTYGAGIPIGLCVVPANRNDFKLVGETRDSRPVLPPPSVSQHMCLDKGYDYPETRGVLDAREFVAHIRSRGEEAREMERNRKRKARRWVVERTHSWMNRFRRLLIRWERKVANYLALAQFACAWITYRAAGLFAARRVRFLY